MATQVPGFAVPYSELAAALLSSSEVVPRARLIAEQAATFVPEGAAVVYVFSEGEGWAPKATAGDVAFTEPLIAADAGTLGALHAKRNVVVFAGAKLPREEYSHLNFRRTLVSLVGIPLQLDEHLIGAVEVLSFGQPIGEQAVVALNDFWSLAAIGLAAGAAYENERNTQLESITRIAQMYDLEKVFNSTLEMEDLLQLITSKFQEVMNVQAVNLWMVAGDELLLTNRAGVDPTCQPGTSVSSGEGFVGPVAESGEPLLVDSPEDERLSARNQGVEEGAIFSLLAGPLKEKDSLVGVVEVINRSDGQPFDEDDQFLLGNITETANNALHNASLLQAERKVEVLQTLVQVSGEITSTLNLEGVMQAIVNGPQAVVPYERAALAVERSGRLQLGAVSGMKQVNRSEPEVARLQDLLQWASMLNEELHISQTDEGIAADREETRAKFERYFADSGMRAFYALPLADDQGRVGILALESSDPDFLTSVHIEMLKVVAAQATVALRNAQMYTEVPFIEVIAPLLQKKQKFMALEARRRRATYLLAAAAVLFLVFFPIPMRVAGDATVTPAGKAQIQPEVEGVVRRVLVREGDAVKRGTVLAEMEDWDYRSALAAAQAKQQTAAALMNRALASNDGTEAGIQRVQADYWTAEVKRAAERLERTQLRSPIDGVVATPHIETFVGRHLEPGDDFAEVLDSSRAQVDVAIEENDMPLLEPGQPAALKLDSFPTRTFRGEVVVVSPQGTALQEQRVFFARVLLDNPEGLVRAGMQGRSKVKIGWRPSGYVLFRGIGMWGWRKLWSWFGW